MIKQRVLLSKALVIGIIILFIGMSVVSSTCGNLIEKSCISLIYSPHDPIYIHGNDDFTSKNGVTGGSGTSNDPYVIEDWEIAASSKDGITIRNVDVYFTIRDCYVHNGGINNDGIVFYNVTNGIIEDTIITMNHNGVMFRTQFPEKENSENNIIRYNDITSNTNDGINFEHTAYGYHSKNIIINNSISSNKRGIFMIMSADNQIVYNNILSNDELGIRLEMCMGGGENNIIHHNNFMYNGDDDEQVFEYGDPHNKWDDDYPSGGNYWSDYNGIDDNGDGIGDTPYHIPVGDNEDRFPLMEPYIDINVPPDVPTVDGPTRGKAGAEYDYTFVTIDPNDDDVYYYIKWGDGNSTSWIGPCNSSEDITLSHSWAENGTYTIKVKAKDIYDMESHWGELKVKISRNRATVNSLFQLFFERFTLLERLLNLIR